MRDYDEIKKQFLTFSLLDTDRFHNIYSKDIQKFIPNCLFFVDDIVLIRSREPINSKLAFLRHTLETMFSLKS